MIIDCDVALVMTRCVDRVRYSRAKVGIGLDKSQTPVLIVITSTVKEKFKIVNNCKVRADRCVDDKSLTISFDAPKKDIYLRNGDPLLLKSFVSLLSKIQNNQLIPKLADISSIEKMKPKPTSLAIKDNVFSPSDLSNKCLQRLSCDNFRLIPRLIWKLNSLRDLQLIGCQLTQIPTQLYDLAQSLRVLDLSNNQINWIDGSFMVAMRRLISLDLNHNQLEAIPYEIKVMTSLERLNISYNKLSHLPNTLGKIASLKTIHLSHNQMNSFPYLLIKNLLLNTRLDNLDIANNPLRQPKKKYIRPDVKPFPSLSSLCAATVLSTDELLFSCHKYLPQSLYKKIVINGENCALCSRTLVDKELQISLSHMSLEQIAVCLTISHFPTFPLVPTLRYVCHFCRFSHKFRND